jgi:twitching motility protein PilJ
MKAVFSSMAFRLFGKRNRKSANGRHGVVTPGAGKRVFARWSTVSILSAIVVSLVLMTVSYFKVTLKDRNDKEYVSLISKLRVLGLRMGKEVTNASNGHIDAFSDLDKAQREIVRIVKLLDEGDASTGMPGTPAEAREKLNNSMRAWHDVKLNTDFILQRMKPVTSLRMDVEQYNDVSGKRLAQTKVLVDRLLNRNAPASQLSLGIEQLLLVEQIAKNMNRTLQGGVESVAAVDDFGRDAASLGRSLNALLEGDKDLGVRAVSDKKTRRMLSELSAKAREDVVLVSNVLANAIEWFQVQDAAKRVVNSSGHFVEEVERLQKAFEKVSERHRAVLIYMGSAFGLIALLGLLGLGLLMMADARSREKDARLREEAARESDRKNQDAILRLLDEMGDLANGDLTVSASVTEDFTGAIADAINYAVNELRNLVKGINTTTLGVAGSAKATRATALELLQASEEQSGEISRATLAATDMATLLEKLSGRAKESSEVAQASVAIATKGSRAVQDTIVGMDSVREQIQETAKRIKRLGESSQEIGEIVGLIDDIADQTNILALNAAIQASMAGDAGRGFAVVADEVQRLAERSRHATKGIDGLVKAIQGDAKEAAASMEKSTAGVVSGAQLAQGAGQALTAIEKVSSQLAGLIAKMSGKASEQATAAANIAGSMSVIQTITTKTSQATQDTAKSIGDLEEQSARLGTSVRGFKLPQEKRLEVNESASAPEYLREEGRAIEAIGSKTAVV